jgi:N-methylhydantoinase B
MPGGGGYGDPYKRPAGKVAQDVTLGLVSAKAARELYGVALTADGAVERGGDNATSGRRWRRVTSLRLTRPG